MLTQDFFFPHWSDHCNKALTNPSNPMNPEEYLCKLLHLLSLKFPPPFKNGGVSLCLISLLQNFSTSVPSGSVHPVCSCRFVCFLILYDIIQKLLTILFSCITICHQSHRPKLACCLWSKTENNR